MRTMLGSIANLLLKVWGRALSQLRTAQATSKARLGVGTKILSSGEVVNIGQNPENIQIGNHCAIAGQLLVFRHGGNISLGDHVFVGEGTHIWSSASVKIGSRVLISHGVEIHDTESHPIDVVARAAHTIHLLEQGHPKSIEGIRSKPIQIGDDVWIGFGATIRKGVTIGDRAIVGARTIVDKDVPADAVLKVRSATSIRGLR